MTDTTDIKKLFEIGFLLRTDETAQDVQRLIVQHQGEIKADGAVRRIPLAYKIGKETQAYFGFFHFLMPSPEVKLLEQDMRRKPSVLRSLIITLPRRKEKPTATTARPRPTYPPAEVKLPSIDRVLSNEALEKKIEEILR